MLQSKLLRSNLLPRVQYDRLENGTFKLQCNMTRAIITYKNIDLYYKDTLQLSSRINVSQR